jgi:hypothetical protein
VGTFNSWPNFTAWLDTAWGAGYEYWRIFGCGAVVKLYYGQNPPYGLDDFYNMYPKFYGPGFDPAADPMPAPVNPPIPQFVLTTYINLANAHLVYDQWQEDWLVGMGLFIAHYATMYLQSDAAQVVQTVQACIHGEIPAGSLPGNTFTLSAVPTNGVLQGLFWNGLFMSPGVDYTLDGVNLVTTATIKLLDTFYAVWPTQQMLAVPVEMTPTQVAAHGIASGLVASKGVGDVSVSYQSVMTAAQFANWGAWNYTRYGQQLITMAQVIGSGLLLVW